MKTFFAVTLLCSAMASAQPVAELRAGIPKADAQKRGRLATGIRPALEALGPRALPEMMEAYFAPREPSWTDSALLAWQVSLLEAMSSFQDARARPLFQRVLADGNAHFLQQRAAAEGLARLGDVEQLVGLIARDAVVAGIGSARKPAVAQALAAELAKHPAEPRAKLIVKALSDVGNSWAWRTLPNREEEQLTRNTAAAALVKAFVDYDGEVRQAATNALLVVDAPATPALIGEGMAGRREMRALEALQQRVMSNPLR